MFIMVILFDGDCNLCNNAIQFIIRKDSNNVFKFSSLHSDYGKRIVAENKMNDSYLSTMILIDGENIYTKSSAAIRIASQLKNYKWMQLLMFIPKFFRDMVYDLVAKNRHLFFKNSSCLLPTKQINEKFIN